MVTRESVEAVAGCLTPAWASGLNSEWTADVLRALLALDDAAHAVCEPCVPLDEVARRVLVMRERLLRRES